MEKMVSRTSLKRFLLATGKILDITSPSEENVQAILEWIMPNLDPNELKVSLVNYYKFLDTHDERYVPYFDPVPGLFQKYGMIQKHQKIAKKVGLNWWSYIQKYVANPQYVLEMVGRKKPEIKRMLATPLGDSYIQYFTKRLYQFFDLWLHEFPRWHKNCGGLILYGLINQNTNAWGFRCRRCGTIVPIDKLDEMTYKQRKHIIKIKNGNP